MISLAIEIYTGHAENFDRFGAKKGGKKVKTSSTRLTVLFETSPELLGFP